MVAVIILLIINGVITIGFMSYIYADMVVRLSACSMVLKTIYADVEELKRTEQDLKIAEKALIEKDELIKQLQIENDFYKGMFLNK